MRRIELILAALVLAAFSFVFVACNNKDEEKNYSVTLEPQSCTMEVGESLTLSCTVEGTDEAVSWTTSNNAVAVVSNAGVVSAIAEGSTTITASVGEKQASCEITVTAAVTNPEISAPSQLELDLNESITPDVSVKYKNVAVDAELQFSSDDEEIVKVDNTGKITAVGYGRTYVNISAAYAGRTAKSQIIVIVRENAEVIFSESELTLEVGASHEVEYVVEIGGSAQDGKTLEWESSDESVATVENGTIMAKAGGETVITGTYNSADGIPVSASLQLTVVLKEDNRFAEESIGTFDLSLNTISVELPIQEKVSRVMLEDGVIISFTQTEGTGSTTLSLQTENLQQYYGEKLLVVETATTSYKVKTVLATLIVSNPTEWKTMFEKAKALGGANEWKGYFTLDADIEFATAVSGVTGQLTAAQGWLATFDGCGHTISDFSLENIWMNGLFGSIGTTGVVKNFAIRRGIINAPASGIIASNLFGTVENIYLQGEIHHTGNNDGHGGIAFRINPGAVLKNCIAEVEIGFSSQGETAIAAFGFVYKYLFNTDGSLSDTLADNSGIENCYVISKTITAVLRVANGVYSNTTNETYPIDSVKLYQSYEEMQAETNDYSAFVEGWIEATGDDLPVWNDYVLTISGEDTVVAGNSSEYRTNEWAYSFGLVGAVEGVSITADGKLTVASTVPDGTEITIEASSVMNKSVPKAQLKVTIRQAEVIDTPVDIGKWVVSDIPSDVGFKVVSDSIQGTITGISIGDVKISDSDVIKAEMIKQYYGPQIITVMTSEKIYNNVSVLIVTDIITSVDEWDNMFALAKALGGEKEWKGYFELGADLDFTDAGAKPGAIEGAYNENQGWLGTLDGCGYAVQNYWLKGTWMSGIIGFIGKTGVVENLAVTGITINGAAHGGIASKLYGTVRNVYVQGNINHSGNSDGHGGIAYRIMSGAQIKNCIVDIYSAWAGGQNHAGIGYVYREGDYSGIQNCFVIDRKTGSDPLPGAVCIAQDDSVTTTEVFEIASVGMYDSEASFAAAQRDLSSFDSNIWKIDGYNLPVFIRASEKA